MPLPTSKVDVLFNLQQAYTKLDAEFDAVETHHQRVKGIVGGICCCDVLAYQIEWGRLLLGWEKMERAGEVVEMPAPGYRWNQLGALAQSFYDAHHEDSLELLRGEFATLQLALVDWIESLTEDELFQTQQRRWAGEKWVMAKWIQVNTIAPYRAARTKVRRWKRGLP